MQPISQSMPKVANLSDRDMTRPRDGRVQQLRRDDFDRDVWCVLGVPVDLMAVDAAIAEIDRSVSNRRQLSFVTPNVNWMVRALRDENARREIIDADLSFIDGAPLLAIARALGAPVASRVAGSDLFEALRRRPSFAARKLKVFFFGGRDGAAEQASAALDEHGGSMTPGGWLNPGFGAVEDMSSDANIERINESDSDFVVVSLGAAKGQAWIDRNKSRLNAPVTAHLGAVVDFTAGGIARAPVFMRRLGLEWLWRIREEPSLWKRYFNDGVGLARILATKFAPQWRKAQTVKPGEIGDAVLDAPGASTVTIRLRGALGRANLSTVREAFRDAAELGRDVRLDASNLKTVDRSFLGMVLMLEKALTRRNRRIFVDGASPSLQKLLRANAMAYSQSAQDGQDKACAPQGETTGADFPKSAA